jgi:hypothetical protein
VGFSSAAEMSRLSSKAVSTRADTTGMASLAAGPKDATVLNLSSAPTGLSVGDTVTLFQDDEAAASLPKNGFWISKKRDTSGTTATGVNWQGSAFNPSTQQRARVVSISGSNVTIWPGVLLPSQAFKTANNPRIGWQTGDIRLAGVEDMRIDANTSAPQNHLATVQFFQASNCWLARCAVLPKTGQPNGFNTNSAVPMRESRNCTVFGCWIGPSAGGGKGTTTSYGALPVSSSLCRVENNIFDRVESPLLVFGPSSCNAEAYNYEIRQSPQEGGTQYHDTGPCMNLREGSHTFKVFGDLFHGVGMMNTHLRLYTFGSDIGFDLQSYHRYQNVLGCVIAAPTRYQSLSSDGSLFDRYSGTAFRLGYNGPDATINNFYLGGENIGVAHDPQVAATLFRWGNYTSADNTTRFSASECPSGEAFFPNPVPSSNTVPISYLYTSRPAYFTVSGVGTVAWPPTGSDVTGGVSVGGRVHKLPAQLVHEASGGAVASFNPGLYGT